MQIHMRLRAEAASDALERQAAAKTFLDRAREMERERVRLTPPSARKPR